MNLTPEILKQWREEATFLKKKELSAGGLRPESFIDLLDELEFERDVSRGHCEEKIQVLQKLNIAFEAMERIADIEIYKVLTKLRGENVPD